MFGSFPPSLWLVCASKVYSGRGADIVYGIITLKMTGAGILSVMAFHEKAGRSQVDSFCFLLVTLFLPSHSRLCRHPSIRTL